MRRLVFLLFLCLPVYVNAQTLVMTSLRTGETEIFSFDLATGSAFNLSSSPHSEDRYACPLYGRNKILFTSNRNGPGDCYQLFIMDDKGGNVKQLTFDTTEVVYYPSWSANGSLILYNLGNSSKAVLMGADGEWLCDFADVRDANLSPTGEMIAFTRRVDNGYCLFVMGIDGTGLKKLTHRPNPLGAVGPVFSPDGSRIVFVDAPDTSREVLEIFSCRSDGSDLRQLSFLGKCSTSPCWSADGNMVSFRVSPDAFWRDAGRREAAYREKTGDKRPVWIMDSDGSAPRLLEPLRYQMGIDGSRAYWLR